MGLTKPPTDAPARQLQWGRGTIESESPTPSLKGHAINVRALGAILVSSDVRRRASRAQRP
jgi:hypothetical protein